MSFSELIGEETLYLHSIPPSGSWQDPDCQGSLEGLEEPRVLGNGPSFPGLDVFGVPRKSLLWNFKF